jgi:macrocin-O-methyltransferase TylF-like protien
VTLKIKSILHTLGPRLGPRLRRRLVSAAGALEFGAWVKEHGYDRCPSVDSRDELFKTVAAEIADQPVLYLEFGVWKGEATRAWARLLRHPDTVLNGFDTFEGLPQSWGNEPAGNYSVGGSVPVVDDPRVTYYKGLFQDTLQSYVPPARDHVVLMMDADLHSSTIFVLRHLRSLVRRGTWIYFDEFNSVGHEERAFRDFIDETGFRFECRGEAGSFAHVLFRRVG